MLTPLRPPPKIVYADERVIHFGMIPVPIAVFVLNELPDLQAIQVALFSILQEKEVQIR